MARRGLWRVDPFQGSHNPQYSDCRALRQEDCQEDCQAVGRIIAEAKVGIPEIPSQQLLVRTVGLGGCPCGEVSWCCWDVCYGVRSVGARKLLVCVPEGLQEFHRYATLLVKVISLL